MPEPVALSRLAEVVPGAELVADRDAIVADIHHDSRAVTPGTLFVAIPGRNVDGHGFAAAALDAGATGLVVERELPLDSAQLLVPDARAAMPILADAIHSHPSGALQIVGITGTNGKTTVAHMVDAIAIAAGRTTAVLGTVGSHIGGVAAELTRTTPEASELQRLLAQMRTAGVDLAAVEVSSHALALRRVDSIRFALLAFTNLSQDHLDFHGSMEDYFAAKSSLFTADHSDHAVVCIDDEWGARLAAATDLEVVTTSTVRDADVVAERVRLDLDYTRFDIVAAGIREAIELPIPGRFNVANALVAAAVSLHLELPPAALTTGLRSLTTIPGRLEVIDEGQPFKVLVDYAHTPEAVATVVAEVRALAPGRLIAVVGAGGDRDQEKRPQIGAAAGGADLAIITSDNPRSEEPPAIVAAVAAGARRSGTEVVEEIDRRAAIRRAVRTAGAGDVVLILGKGHEQGQEFAGGRVVPFDDRQVATDELLLLADNEAAV